MIPINEKAAVDSGVLAASQAELNDNQGSSVTDKWHRRYRVESLLFLLLWSTFAYFYQATQQNEAVRFDQTRAIVADHTLAINKYWFNSADIIHYSKNGQDLIYPNKAPGTSLVAIPGFFLASQLLQPALAVGLQPGIYWHLVAYATIVSGISLLSALAGLAMFLILKRMTGDVGFAVLTVLAIWFGTLVFTFSTLFFSHAQAAAQLILAFYFIFSIRYDGVESMRQTQVFLVLAGLLLGFSVATEYPTVLLGGILTFYALWVISRLQLGRSAKARLAGAMGMGLLIGGGILLSYNLAAFGKLVYFPYEAYAKAGSPFPTYTRGFLGLRWPGFSNLLSALAAITIYPPVGILYFRVERWALYACNPVLWLVLPGLGIMLWRAKWRAEGIMIAAMIVAYLLFITNYGTSIYDWGGGGYLGSRHLVPLLPFLALPLHFAARKLKWLFFPLFAISVFYMLIATAVEPRVNYPIPVPARDLHLPDYLRGRLAQNSDGLFGPGKLTRDSTAFNLAKLAGVPGRYQLAPLMLWWLISGGVLLLTVAKQNAGGGSDHETIKQNTEESGRVEAEQLVAPRSSKSYVTHAGLAALFVFVSAITVAPIVHYQRRDVGTQGLQGQYFRSPDWMGEPAEVKIEAPINFDWSNTMPFQPPFSVEWNGNIMIERPGDYAFALISDDGSYLEIDGQLVVDARKDSVFAKREGLISLSRGLHKIRLRYFNLLFGGSVKLLWTQPDHVEQVVPADVLRPPSP